MCCFTCRAPKCSSWKLTDTPPSVQFSDVTVPSARNQFGTGLSNPTLDILHQLITTVTVELVWTGHPVLGFGRQCHVKLNTEKTAQQPTLSQCASEKSPSSLDPYVVGEGRNKMNPGSSLLTPTTLACCHCPAEHPETDTEVWMWHLECQWKANHHFPPAHTVAQAACGWLSLPQGCSTASCHLQGHQSYLTFRATRAMSPSGPPHLQGYQ